VCDGGIVVTVMPAGAVFAVAGGVARGGATGGANCDETGAAVGDEAGDAIGDEAGVAADEAGVEVGDEAADALGDEAGGVARGVADREGAAAGWSLAVRALEPLLRAAWAAGLGSAVLRAALAAAAAAS